MKTITNDFKENINQLGRILDNKINVYENYILKTEDDKKILTQNDILLIANAQSKDLTQSIDSEHLYNIQVIQKGNILSTMMKELDFESDIALNVGTTLSYDFGLYVNNEFEYINYGDFIVYEKEYNEDTKHWNYICYDSMLKTMIMLDDVSIIENNTIAESITYIANKFNLKVNIDEDILEEYPNLEKTIADGAFTDMEITYRDVLEQICQAVGTSMYIDSNEIKFKGLNTEIVDTIDKSYLKNTNVTFKENYGPINSLVLSRSEDSDNLYYRDNESIEQNGLHEFKIKDNLILNGNDREEYIENIFNQINGLEFYINDFESVGICYLDWLDFYNIDIDGNIYKCLMLNDEIKINNGLSESIYTEAPEETITDYTTAGKTDKEVSFLVDKQNKIIKSKVSQDEMESYVEQTASEINSVVATKVGNNEVISKINQSAEQVSINANRISLAGKTISLSGDNIQIASNNFNVDTSGNLECSSAKITGGSIKLSSDQANDVVQVGGTTSGGVSVLARMGWAYFDLYREGTRNLRLHCGGTTAGGIIQINDGSGNSNINLVGSNGNITCVSLTQTSLEESKKNFEKIDNALDIIKNIDIYKYNYKNEDDKDKKHIGFVIGKNYKYSNDITSVDENNKENGVDLYSFVSVCCKAIQEQQEQIEELKQKIEQLKRSDK